MAGARMLHRPAAACCLGLLLPLLASAGPGSDCLPTASECPAAGPDAPEDHVKMLQTKATDVTQSSVQIAEPRRADAPDAEAPSPAREAAPPSSAPAGKSFLRKCLDEIKSWVMGSPPPTPLQAQDLAATAAKQAKAAQAVADVASDQAEKAKAEADADRKDADAKKSRNDQGRRGCSRQTEGSRRSCASRCRRKRG